MKYLIILLLFCSCFDYVGNVPFGSNSYEDPEYVKSQNQQLLGTWQNETDTITITSSIELNSASHSLDWKDINDNTIEVYEYHSYLEQGDKYPTTYTYYFYTFDYSLKDDTLTIDSVYFTSTSKDSNACITKGKYYNGFRIDSLLLGTWEAIDDTTLGLNSNNVILRLSSKYTFLGIEDKIPNFHLYDNLDTYKDSVYGNYDIRTTETIYLQEYIQSDSNYDCIFCLGFKYIIYDDTLSLTYKDTIVRYIKTSY